MLETNDEDILMYNLLDLKEHKHTKNQFSDLAY